MRRGRGHDPGDTAQAPDAAKQYDQAQDRAWQLVHHGGTVSLDEDGEPFEVFGSIGKAGSFTSGVTELACRLISLHLRRGTPLGEIVEQIQGIQEMQPFANQLSDGSSVWVLGLGDAIAHILRGFLKARQEREEKQRGEEEGTEAKAAA